MENKEDDADDMFDSQSPEPQPSPSSDDDMFNDNQKSLPAVAYEIHPGMCGGDVGEHAVGAKLGKVLARRIVGGTGVQPIESHVDYELSDGLAEIFAILENMREKHVPADGGGGGKTTGRLLHAVDMLARHLAAQCLGGSEAYALDLDVLSADIIGGFAGTEAQRERAEAVERHSVAPGETLANETYHIVDDTWSHRAITLAELPGEVVGCK